MGAAGSNLYYYYYFLQSVKIVSGSAVLDPYYFAFLNAKTYRECCYRCPYAEEKRVSDFTFADYWSAERFHPELAGSNGVSILTFNTEKSLTYKGQIEESMNLIPSKLEWIKQINFNLNQPAERPACRDSIYRDIQNTAMPVGRMPIAPRWTGSCGIYLKSCRHGFAYGRKTAEEMTGSRFMASSLLLP